MNRTYSIKQRVIRAVGEIIFGSIAILFLLLVLSYLFYFSGQLNTYGSNFDISIGDTASSSSIIKQMDSLTFDYILFDSKTGEVLSGNYQNSDITYYNEVFDQRESETIGTVLYEGYSNSDLFLVVRKPTIPEFVNPSLRQISVNTFSYIIFLGLELPLIMWSIIRLLREFTYNFRLIQKISLNMGKSEGKVERTQTKMIEFNDTLAMLYQKDDELITLLEAERTEKKDLSFQVAALSHDVKTPLTVLKGNIELLEMTDLSDQQSGFVRSMNTSVGVFEKYFNSMMTYSRLLTEDKDYQERIDLNDFLDELTVEAKDILLAENINFEISDIAESREFKGNRFNLIRALINILVNAAQHSLGEKKVILSIREEGEFLHFEVWNSGSSFSSEALKNANTLFFTEDNGRSGKHYGIGLSFALGVALRHRGQLLLINPPQGGAQVNLLVRK